MIPHLEETKAALKEKKLRVFKEEVIFKTALDLGMVLGKELTPNVVLKALEFKKALIETPYEKIHLCYWPEVTVYEMAQALKPNAYLSHLAALGFHELAPEPLQHLVVNEEQSAKPQSNSRLTQGSIDNAFKAQPRTTNNIGIWKNKGKETTFLFINGKQTKQAGVIEAPCGPATIRVTNVARTLLDCVVRAFYGGEPTLILQAFHRACKKHDVSDLMGEMIQLLGEVGHKYPYHQSIGFYFETACPHLPSNTWQPLHDLGIEFQFYLTYRMKEPLFNERWMVHYPRDLSLDFK